MSLHMNQDQLKCIAMVEIEKENFNQVRLEGISLNEDNSNDHVKEYIGSIYYIDDDGEEVSSTFAIFEYSNGTHAFEW